MNIVHWCEQRVNAAGKITLILSVLMAVVGFPMQIWKTYQEHHCGIHWVLVVVPIGIYFARIPYSIGKRAWALLPSDIIGLISCVILLIQTVIYNW